MKVLVTGAAGYIGRNLCRQLKALGHQTVEIDRVKGTQYEIDVSQPWESPETFDALVHLAAFPSVTQTNSQKAYCDAQATMHTLNVAGNNKMIFTSSAAVYGNRKNARVEDPVAPLGYYAWSKVMGEMMCVAAHDCTVLRVPNVYGGDDTRGVWAKFRKAKESGVPAMIYGDGTALRTYVHIDKVVQEIIDELDDSAITRNVLGEDWTVNEIAGKVGCDAVHCPPFEQEALINTVR